MSAQSLRYHLGSLRNDRETLWNHGLMRKPRWKSHKGGNPSAHGVHRHAHLLREVAVHELPSRLAAQSLDQHLHLVDLLNLCQVADVFPDQLRETWRPPPAAESHVAPEERLRVPSVTPQRFEIRLFDPAWDPDDSLRIASDR